jgi:hypothetical protein
MSRSHEWSTIAEFAANGPTIHARDTVYTTYRAVSGDLQSGVLLKIRIDSRTTAICFRSMTERARVNGAGIT